MTARVEGGILITPEDIPALAGMTGGMISHLEDLFENGEVPGSLKGRVDMILDFARRLDKVIDPN